MNPLSFKAVIVGGIVDVLGSFLAALVISVVIIVDITASVDTQTTHGHATSSMLEAPALAPSLIWVIVGIGSVIIILAGFVAGRIAGHDRVLNGAASSGLRMVAVLGMTLLSQDASSLPWLFGALVQGPVLGALGGYLSTLGRIDANAPAPAE